MIFFYYVGVVSIPTTPVRAACVLPMCKAGLYFRLRSLLLSVCSFWPEGFNDWGGRGYDDFVPGEVTKKAPSGDRTTRSPTWSASLPRIHRI